MTDIIRTFRPERMPETITTPEVAGAASSRQARAMFVFPTPYWIQRSLSRNLSCSPKAAS